MAERPGPRARIASSTELPVTAQVSSFPAAPACHTYPKPPGSWRANSSRVATRRGGAGARPRRGAPLARERKAETIPMPAMKIAIIGAGSVGFTRKLVTDVLCVPELQDVDIALTDIDERNLGMVRQILETIVAVNRLPTRITATADRRRALEGARYVINCVRIGGLEAFADDIRIPLQYGVDQCVGDTICAGGHSLRSAVDPGHPRLLQGHPRGLRVAGAASQLRQSDGDEHLGGDRPRQGRDDRPLPRRPAWLAADRRGARRRRPARGRIRLLRHQSSDLVHRRSFPRPAHRPRRAGRRLRAPSRLFAAGKGSDRRPQALRLLFDREQRPSVGISALVPQASRRDRPLDRHVGMDPRRDRRLSALLPRDAQLVRDRISRLSGGGQEADRCRPRAPTSTRATSSRRWRPAALIAATSTSRTMAS